MEYTSLDVLLMWAALGISLWAAKECLINMGGVLEAILFGISMGAALGIATNLFMILFYVN